MTNISFLTLKVVKEKAGRYDLERKISSPQDCYNLAKKVLKIEDNAEESMWLVTLNTKNNVTGVFEVSRGCLNMSIIHPREIFKRAILQNAASIILYHNHPSGDPLPSNEDVNITNRMKKAGELIGISVLDHIIVGENRYTSLKEGGIL